MNKSQLRNWILRKLGSPMINIELDNSQIDDRIEDAIYKFCTFHYDGSDVKYFAITVSEGVGEYTLDSKIIDVLKLLPDNGINNFSDEPLLYNPFFVGAQDPALSSFDMVDIETYRQVFKNIDKMLTEHTMFDWNETTKKLTIFELPIETKIIYGECFVKDSDETKYYTNDWFKKYATALCKKQWGENISKYEGTALPGGVSLNFNRILEESKEEIEKLEEELYERHTKPIDFFIG